MVKYIVFTILPFLMVLFIPAYAYVWDDPELDLVLSMPNKNGWKQNEITIFLESCDSTQKICYSKNRIAYVPVQIEVYKIVNDKEIFVESFNTETTRAGTLAHAIFIGHEYDSHALYEIRVYGSHNGITDTESVNFWTHEKTY